MRWKGKFGVAFEKLTRRVDKGLIERKKRKGNVSNMMKLMLGPTGTPIDCSETTPLRAQKKDPKIIEKRRIRKEQKKAKKAILAAVIRRKTTYLTRQ